MFSNPPDCVRLRYPVRILCDGLSLTKDPIYNMTLLMTTNTVSNIKVQDDIDILGKLEPWCLGNVQASHGLEVLVYAEPCRRHHPRQGVGQRYDGSSL